jgi:hypothetical protein
MGWRKRAKKQGIDVVCYLCEKTIGENEDADRDHVPPKRVFASAVRTALNTNLASLPTHVECNRAYRDDEEYFVVCLAGHVQSAAATEVMNDLRSAADENHGRGTIKEVISQFSTVVGPRGERLYAVERARIERVVRKITRGLYTLDTGKTLPESFVAQIHLIDPKDPAAGLAKIGWFETVRDTEPLARYGNVFDYKWLGWKDNELRGHAMAMLFWDGVIVALIFHDPTCDCDGCRAARSKAGTGKDQP